MTRILNTDLKFLVSSKPSPGLLRSGVTTACLKREGSVPAEREALTIAALEETRSSRRCFFVFSHYSYIKFPSTRFLLCPTFIYKQHTRELISARGICNTSTTTKTRVAYSNSPGMQANTRNITPPELHPHS